jgi:PAS domain S-box-containing protein
VSGLGEEHHRILFEAANDAIFLVGDGRIQECNQKAVEMFACSREVLLKQSPRRLFPENQPDGRSSQETSEELMRRALGGERLLLNWRHRRFDAEGSEFDSEATLSSVELDGTPHLVVVLRDVTERQRSDRQLRRSEARFREIFENSGDAICVFQDDRFVLVNAQFEALFGFPRDQMTDAGFAFMRMVDPESMEEVAEMAAKWQRGGTTPRRFSVGALSASGDKLRIDVNLTDIHWDDRPAVLCVARDITEQRRLQEAQRLEAVGRLAGGVAHDFNNLLTAITGNAELARAMLRPGDPVAEDMEEILRTTRRAGELTRQLLAFSRRQVLAARVVNLNAIVEDLSRMLQRILGEQIELRLLLDPKLGKTRADPVQMQQVIVNLAVNAKDAMAAEGGQLTIETRSCDCVGIRPELEGPCVELIVRDNGCGMSREVRSRIFEPFYSTKGEGKGTGLGLSTVYGIVRQSGGDIQVESSPGEGSTFRIQLPLVEVDDEETVEPEPPADVPYGRETVLVVEDEELVRKLAVRALRRYGYNAISAANGGEALMICKDPKQSIDLVLTDVVMPYMSGVELAESLRQHNADIKVLFMSGYADESEERGGALAPDAHFIQKPFRPMALVQKVRKVLDE